MKNFLLFVVATVARGKRRAASKNAYDHMELGAKRDYREPASRERSKDLNDSAEEEFDVKKAVESSRPSDEVLKEELEAEKIHAEAAPVAQQANENGGYHLTRETPAAPAETKAEEQPAPRKRNRRSDRKKAANEDE